MFSLSSPLFKVRRASDKSSGVALGELEARIQRLDALEAAVIDSTGVVVEDGG